MTYDEAILTLAEKILSNDFEGALTACDSFPKLEFAEKEQLRNQLTDLFNDIDVLPEKDVTQILDKFNLEKVEPLKAQIDLARNPYKYTTAEKLKKSQAYTLLNNEQTEYYNDLERSGLIRATSTLAIQVRDVPLIKELLALVQKYGI